MDSYITANSGIFFLWSYLFPPIAFPSQESYPVKWPLLFSDLFMLFFFSNLLSSILEWWIIFLSTSTVNPGKRRQACALFPSTWCQCHILSHCGSRVRFTQTHSWGRRFIVQLCRWTCRCPTDQQGSLVPDDDDVTLDDWDPPTPGQRWSQSCFVLWGPGHSRH